MVPDANIPPKIPFTSFVYRMLELKTEQIKQQDNNQINIQHLLFEILQEGETGGDMAMRVTRMPSRL